MIYYFKRTIQQRTIKEIPNFEIGCWINVFDPSPEEIDYLAKEFSLDKKNLESGLDQNELPRLDFVAGDVYLFTKIIPKIKKREIETYLIVVAKKFILTLSKTQPDFIKDILEGKVNFVTTQKLKCLIKLFSLINESFEKVTAEVVKSVGRKRDIGELEEKELETLLSQENILNNLVSSYNYINLLYQRVIRRIEFFPQDKEIIEDLTIEAAQGLEICKSSLKTISNLRNYYSILISNKLNRIITILTVFTILISLPAAISGIYGMNILLPLQKNPFAFYYILALIGAIWGVFLFYLKKKKII